MKSRFQPGYCLVKCEHDDGDPLAAVHIVHGWRVLADDPDHEIVHVIHISGVN